jgi:hypothetical protein
LAVQSAVSSAKSVGDLSVRQCLLELFNSSVGDLSQRPRAFLSGAAVIGFASMPAL